jgi:hypothetical protein
MSDTPRTDALLERFESEHRAAPDNESLAEAIIATAHQLDDLAEHAKKIERELEVCRAVTKLCCEKQQSQSAARSDE